MRILKDKTYYFNRNDDLVIITKWYHNYYIDYELHDYTVPKSMTESEWNLIKRNFEFSHKIRIVEIDYNGEKLELSRDLGGWKNDNSFWGAYNRAHKIDLKKIEKDYQLIIRKNKLERLLK